MPSDFVHLHVHTDYSILDGACSVSQLKATAQKNHMPAVAMTDHGFMGGAIDMYNTFTKGYKDKDFRVKPIIGTEFYVSPTTRFDKTSTTPNIRGYHLVLLAKNNDGYKSLCKLHSIGAKEGFYYKPRIDRELLEKYSDGLICMSACIQGEISRTILSGDIKKAKEVLKWHLDLYGRENFYLEIMDHGIPEEKIVNKEMVLLSKEFEIPLVATNDVHYIKKEHSRAHEMMLCIQTKSTMDNEKHFKFYNDSFYFKNETEMKELFKEIPEAVTNTREVAEKCNIEFDLKTNHYPEWPLEVNGKYTNRKDLLRDNCLKEVPELYNFDPKTPSLTKEQQNIMDRIDFELGVIDRMGFCSYFLVVQDFILWAYDQDIPVGPGRGSGAGSIIAYLTRITDVEPLRFGLLFERFLNPDRVSPPDFDIDFCERRREEVIDYVRGKYGAEQVSQIGTYGTLKAKAIIKDIARVSGFPADVANKITKTIDGSPKNFEKAKEENPDFIKLLQSDSQAKKILEDAKPLVGLNRNMSTHAAGVIIGDQRLDNLIPLSKAVNKNPDSNEIILQTQFSAVPCEELGLLKMDFLGLRTLTVIDDAIKNAEASKGVNIDFTKLGFEDPKTFELIRRGDTIGVFQLESDGMQRLCRSFGVETIEHVIALIAIYRPGPMQFIPAIKDVKFGRKVLEEQVAHPLMLSIVKETYGFMIYQEQIMQVVQKLAGFSLGEADILRRAIGKKKEDVLKAQKDKFVKGCFNANKISQKDADNIWTQIEKFASYGFNKSHSAAYAFLSYRTAYLKANYPSEFMAATLSSELKNADKIRFIINECKEMDIEILSPDVNASEVDFSVEGESIRFGLGGVKGVGTVATEEIIEARREYGNFESLLDFCEKTKCKIGSKMLESLCRAGAFDSFNLKRSQMVQMVDSVLTHAQNKIKDEAAGQASLFDFLGEEDQASVEVQVPDIPEFNERDMLKDENELIGFYVTGHPLSKYADMIKTYSTVNTQEIKEFQDNIGVNIGGMIKSAKKMFSKKGNEYGIMQLEDLNGITECSLYGDTYQEYKDTLIEDKVVYVSALTSKRDEEDTTRLTIQNIIPFEQVYGLKTQEIHIHLYEASTKLDEINAIKNLIMENLGRTIVILYIKTLNGNNIYVESLKLRVHISENFMSDLHDIMGERKYTLVAASSVPEPRINRWAK